MRRLLRQHEEKQQTGTSEVPDRGVVPAYLLDRQQQTTGKVLSSLIKQKRKEKAVRKYFYYISYFIVTLNTRVESCRSFWRYLVSFHHQLNCYGTCFCDRL